MFTGAENTISFSTWMESIRLSHELNGFTVDQTMRLVRARVDGTAKNKLDKIPRSATFDTIEALIDEIRGVFADDQDAFAKLNELWRNGQQKNESPEDLARRLKNLMRNALGEGYNERLGCNIFISALTERDMAIQVGLREPQTIDQARDYAITFQRTIRSYDKKEQKSKVFELGSSHAAGEPMEIDRIFRPGPSNAPRRRDDQAKPVVCYYCEKTGHVGSNCLLLKQHRSQLKRYQLAVQRMREKGRGRGRFQNDQRRPMRGARTMVNGSIKEMREAMEQLGQMEDDGLFEDEEFIQELEEVDEEEDNMEVNQDSEDQQKDFQ